MRRRAGALAALVLAAGCSLLYPPRYERLSRLVAVEPSVEQLTVRDDGALVHEQEGLRIEVRHLTDAELNSLFPKESRQGKHSYNPYTYGDDVDPHLGYAPSRFTVFDVALFNHGFARTQLQPLRCRLETSTGRVLEPYGVDTGSGTHSLEDYYRARRGPLGNDDYRFEVRMGLIRTTAYMPDEVVLRGESASGLLVFDDLQPQEDEVILHIDDVVLRFNAFGEPLQKTSVRFPMRHDVTFRDASDHGRDGSTALTRVRLAAASEVGGAGLDLTRQATTIDAVARSGLDDLRRCFEPAYLSGSAEEGSVRLGYSILPSGLVSDVRAVAASVGSEVVLECVLQRVRTWRYRPSGSALPDSTAGVVRPTALVSVVSTFLFEPVPE